MVVPIRQDGWPWPDLGRTISSSSDRDRAASVFDHRCPVVVVELQPLLLVGRHRVVVGEDVPRGLQLLELLRDPRTAWEDRREVVPLALDDLAEVAEVRVVDLVAAPLPVPGLLGLFGLFGLAVLDLLADVCRRTESPPVLRMLSRCAVTWDPTVVAHPSHAQIGRGAHVSGRWLRSMGGRGRAPRSRVRDQRRPTARSYPC